MFYKYEQLVLHYFLVLINESTSNKRLINKKAENIMPVLFLIFSYANDFFEEKLVEKIFSKKINYLINAESIEEIKQIAKPSIPYYNYSEFIPASEFHIIEEELIIWSKTSFEGPLNEAGYNRFMKVFEMVYPEKYKLL